MTSRNENLVSSARPAAGAGTALVGRAMRGDRQAFQELFEEFKDPIFRFINRMVGGAHDAEDLLQEVFVKIFQNLPALRDPEAFPSWLFTAARNECINFLRKQSRRRMDSLDASPATELEMLASGGNGSIATPEQAAGVQEMRDLVLGALGELPENNRAAFILGVLEGYPYREVASILGCSVNNVKVRIFRARSSLCKRLSPYFQRANAAPEGPPKQGGAPS